MSYIVCGWYTPDYRPWWDKLRPTLEEVDAPYDFIEVRKREGGWERNTMSKASQVLSAMSRHPTKPIIFLDVDCEVRSSLVPLVHITGDVGLHVRTRRKSDHTIKMWARSGTMVLNPHDKTRAFVEAWVAASADAERWAVDQDSLIQVIASVPNLSLTMLGVEWCATASDKCQRPKIYHDSASINSKTPKWRKWLGAAA